MGGATVGESINLELNLSATAQIGLNDAAVRTLAGISSGAIDLNTFKGKSNAIFYALIGAGQTNFDSSWHFMQNFGRVPIYNGFAFPGGGGNNSYSSFVKVSLSDGSVPVKTSFIYSGSSSHYVPATCIDSSGNYYQINNLGWPNSAVWVITKFDSSGNVVFEKSLRINPFGSYVIVLGAICDSSGNIYVTGYAQTSPGQYGYLIKFDSSGTLLWGKSIYPSGGQNQVYGRPAFLSNGNILCIARFNTTSYYLVEYNSSGTLISSQLPTWAPVLAAGNHIIDSIDTDSSGNIFIKGNTGTQGTTYVAKLNSSRAVQWVRSITTTNQYTGDGPIVADQAGGCLVAQGNYTTGFCSLVGIDSSGTMSFTRELSTGGSSATWDQNYLANMVVSGGQMVFSFGHYTHTAGSSSTTPTSALGVLPKDGSGLGVYRLNGILFYYNIGSATVATTQGGTTVTLSLNNDASYSATSVTADQLTTRTSPTTNSFPYTMTSTTGSIDATVKGSYSYTRAGTYSWICPTGVTSASVVAIAGGSGGASAAPGSSGSAGAGGALAYRNNIAVTAANPYQVVVGGGGGGGPAASGWWNAGGAGGVSSFNIPSGSVPLQVYAQGGFPTGSGCNVYTIGGGSPTGGPVCSYAKGDAYFIGGAGQRCYSGGGAAGYAGGGFGLILTNGYSPTGGGGGGGGPLSQPGGGVGLGGIGPTGGPGTTTPGSFGYNKFFGGGGTPGQSGFVQYTPECGDYNLSPGGNGGNGGVRIVYPGSSRSFPNTDVSSR